MWSHWVICEGAEGKQDKRLRQSKFSFSKARQRHSYLILRPDCAEWIRCIRSYLFAGMKTYFSNVLFCFEETNAPVWFESNKTFRFQSQRWKSLRWGLFDKIKSEIRLDQDQANMLLLRLKCQVSSTANLTLASTLLEKIKVRLWNKSNSTLSYSWSFTIFVIFFLLDTCYLLSVIYFKQQQQQKLYASEQIFANFHHHVKRK